MDDNKIDVVAVDGNITGVDNQQIGSGQDKYITGGDYSFNRDGQEFAVQVSQGGSLSADDDTNILDVSGAGDVVVRDLDLYVNPTTDAESDNKAIYADDSFGNLVVDNVTTNGRLVIDLDGAGKTGNVSVTNSNFDTGSWVGTSDFVNEPEDVGTVVFAAQDGAQLTVGKFTNNTISTAGSYATAVYNFANGMNSRVLFDGDFGNNRIETQGKKAYGVYNYALNKGEIIFNGTFSNNIIDTVGNDAFGIYNYVDGGNIMFNSGIIGNQIDTNNAYGMYNWAENGASLTVNGLFNNNLEDFYFAADDMGSNITVSVNDGSNGLSAANHSANVEIKPGSEDYVHIFPGD